MSFGRDGIWLGGVGSDIFGEHNVARPNVRDRENDILRTKLMQEYIAWQRENNGFYEGFERDVTYYKTLCYGKWVLAASGVAFAAAVINPNFTRRRAFYLRKIIPFSFGVVFYQYGYKLQNTHLTSMLLKMNDYLPLEVRRTLQTKDARHMATFDYRNPNRKLFDEKTRKAL